MMFGASDREGCPATDMVPGVLLYPAIKEVNFMLGCFRFPNISHYHYTHFASVILCHV